MAALTFDLGPNLVEETRESSPVNTSGVAASHIGHMTTEGATNLDL